MPEINSVNGNERNEIHNKISSSSPNALYKSYLNWFNNKYGKEKTPLSFKQWIEWAKTKSIVKNEPTVNEEELNDTEEENISESITTDRTKQIIIVITLLTGIGILTAIAIKR